MDIRKFIAVDGTLYMAEDIKVEGGGGCKGCVFMVLPARNEICDSVDCSGIIFKEAGLGGLLTALAMTYKEN